MQCDAAGAGIFAVAAAPRRAGLLRLCLVYHGLTVLPSCVVPRLETVLATCCVSTMPLMRPAGGAAAAWHTDT